jgi:putative ABC transport system permease protein
VQPATGRAFSEAEDLPRSHATVAVISDRLWRRQFSADPHLIGRTIRIDGENRTVIGIMPPGFSYPLWDEYPAGVDLWLPLAADPDHDPERKWHYLFALARLKNGVSVQAAQDDLKTIAAQIEREMPTFATGWSARVMPLRDRIAGTVKPTLTALLAAVALLLTMSCASVATLMLARSTEKSTEFAMRVAIGAGRWRLIRQLLTESLVLGVLGGFLGLLLTAACLRSILAVSPEDIPNLRNAAVDLRMLAFSVAVSLLTSCLFGLFAAVRGARPGSYDLLRGMRSGLLGAVAGKRLQSVLVVVLVGLVFVLLLGGGLLLRSLHRIQQVDPHFTAENRLTLHMSPSSIQYQEPPQRSEFVRRVVDAVAVVPGVKTAGATSHMPIGDVPLYATFTIEGRPATRAGEVFAAKRANVYPGYFEAMGIRLVQGRYFDARDRQEGVPVVIISREMARRYWPNEDPIGRKVRRGPNLYTIAGVVDDVATQGLGMPFEPVWYGPIPQNLVIDFTLVVHTAVPPMRVSGAVRQAIASIDREQAVYRVATLQEVVNQSIAPRRFMVLLIVIFAALGLVITSVAIYGALSYRVTQLYPVIGLRMAIGETPQRVLQSVIGQGVRLVLAGMLAGAAAFFIFRGVLRSYLYGVAATDPVTFVSVVAFLMIVALVSTYLPARRASRIDPAVTLRLQ